VLFRVLNVFRSYKPQTFFGGMGILFFLLSCALGRPLLSVRWEPTSGNRSRRLSSRDAAGDEPDRRQHRVIVQLINFRFLELDSMCAGGRSAARRAQSGEPRTTGAGAAPANRSSRPAWRIEP
jgi:hypothetical protein